MRDERRDNITTREEIGTMGQEQREERGEKTEDLIKKREEGRGKRE